MRILSIIALVLLLSLSIIVAPLHAYPLHALVARIARAIDGEPRSMSQSQWQTETVTVQAQLAPDGTILYNGLAYALPPLLQSRSLTDDPADCPPAEPHLISYTESEFWIYIGVCLTLLLCGGLISGLTIGLFSLSNLELEVLQEDPEASDSDRRNARRLQPLLKESRHHLLLVTLLLTNTAAMEALPEVLDKIVPEWAAVLISVSLVLVFSEILPQSICTKAPLAIGAFFSPLVWVLMVLLFPVAWPIAKALDYLIGSEGGPQFLASRSQVTSLLEIIKRHNVLSDEEASIMQTIVQLKSKKVTDVMIPESSIYMLNMDDRLNAAKLQEILSAGHSRVPVYRGDRRDNIQGVLLTKRLIIVRPEDEDPVSKYADLKPVWVKPNTDVFSLLDEFQQGHSHLAIVSEHLHDVAMAYHSGADLSETTKVLGIVTMEDLVGEALSIDLSDRAERDPNSNHEMTITKRGKGQHRIVDPRHAKPATLNSMLEGLTILAEQKGIHPKHRQANANPNSSRNKATIPTFQRAKTLTAKGPSGGRNSPSMIHQHRQPHGRLTSRPSPSNTHGNARSVLRKPVNVKQSKNVSLQEPLLDGNNDSLDNLIRIESEEKSLVLTDANTSYRSQSAATTSLTAEAAARANIFTPHGASRRTFEFPHGSPFNDSRPVLVEEQLPNGQIRVTIASKDAAEHRVECINRMYEEQEKRDATNNETDNDETSDIDPVSAFAAKILDRIDASGKSDSDDCDTDGESVGESGSDRSNVTTPRREVVGLPAPLGLPDHMPDL